MLTGFMRLIFQPTYVIVMKYICVMKRCIKATPNY